MEGASAVPPPSLRLPAAAVHAPPPATPAPVPTSTATPATSTNPTPIPTAGQAPGPGPGPGPGPHTNTTAEVSHPPGIPPAPLTLLSKSTNETPSLASRPDALGLGHENHHAVIPPRPEPLPPQTRQPGPAVPRVPAQPPQETTQPEPEPAMITSDVAEAPPPMPWFVPGLPTHQVPRSAATAGGGPNRGSTAATSDTPDQTRRDALRMALKRRWESGDMDQVPKKRFETKMRKKMKEGLRLQAAAKAHFLSSYGTGKFSERFSKDQSSNPAATDPPRVTSGVAPARSANSERSGVSRHTADVPMADLADDPDDEDWQPSDSDRPSSPLSSLGANTPDPTASSNMDLGEGTPPSLEMATADRPYKIFIDATGTPGPTFGALIPDGYQLSEVFPDLPFICPIRSCRKVLRDIKTLGCHFMNLHRAALLHDNEDGTLSFLGLYRPQIKGEKFPALVVSKGPPDPSDPGPVPPSMVPKKALSKTPRQPEMPLAISSTAASAPKRSDGLLTGDWQTLWNYIRPFMVEHNGEVPPQTGWVPHLLTLPRIRDIEWNTSWISSHPFRDSKARDVSAVIIQVTGELASVPCVKCANGTGPFKGCVMISSEAQYAPLEKILACANCFYHYGQTYCSHKAWGLERAKKLLQERKAGGTLHTVGYASPQSGYNDTIGDDAENPSRWEGEEAEASGVQPYDARDGGDNAHDEIDGEQSREASGTPPPDFPIIHEAEPGRPYDMWPDSTTGELQPTSGALLPAGYKLDKTTAKRPWICPVRTCRQLFIKLNDLGYHFQRGHSASLLNDNGDGTLSTKGVYRARKVSQHGQLLAKSYPYVVSRLPDPQVSTNTDLAQPNLPPSGRPKVDVEKPLLATPVHNVDHPAVRAPMDLWDYLQPFLSATTSPPDGGFVQPLLTLPRVRDVELLPPRLADGTFGSHPREFHEKTPRDVAALVIQATGDAPPEPCQRCFVGKGLMKGCVVISTQSSADARRRYYSCANCLYHGNQTYCSLKPWVIDRPQPPYVRPNASEIARLYEVPNSTPSEGSPVPSELYRRKAASEMAQPAAQESSFKAGTSLNDAASAIKDVRNAARPQRASPPIPPPRQWTTSANQAPTPQPAQPSSLISAGVIQPSDILEMETWEVAPGRIRESSGADAENIAFSKAYLSTNKVVPVCEDVSFRVDTIHAGGTLTMEAEANKSRLCAIAAGKVKVKMGDEPEFTIGPHGMFRIKPGTPCAVQNRMYMDAIVHVTVLTGFM